MVTFGIYFFWFMAKLLKWQLSNTVVFAEGGAPMGMMGGGMQQQQMAMGGQQPQLGGPMGQPMGQQQYGQPGPY
ncbi:MAG: hypothetical protein KC431_26360, partial [Myxococcales bacterium]|nr:hypothetical protein [Myxococcales bacterium]